MGQSKDRILTPSVQVVNASGASSIVLVCEHASALIPDEFAGLGLSAGDQISHAAWDPGALAIAARLSERLDAVLIAGTVSRLVYDLNRAPGVPGAMPAQSEVIAVPGNANLSDDARADRAARYYTPFHKTVADVMAQADAPILVTIHSFTPVYHGTPRQVEIGVLHGTDSRLADAMLQCAGAHTQADVQRNAPYGPEDGVLHTLEQHGLRHNHLNVMLEVRNDLVTTPQAQTDMADMIAAWLADACAGLTVAGGVSCVA